VRQPEYLFGHSESAGRRLKLLASVCDESTRAFLKNAAGNTSFPLALDLGCGPGFTTRLINDTLRCDRIIGLDASGEFINPARATNGEQLAFLQHDVTAIPFPVGRANLIFSRFLLTHLRDSEAVVAKWATQLEHCGPGDVEVERVHSSEL
jgi:trans-aconitate 2-methyltransferase